MTFSLPPILITTLLFLHTFFLTAQTNFKPPAGFVKVWFITNQNDTIIRYTKPVPTIQDNKGTIHYRDGIKILDSTTLEKIDYKPNDYKKFWLTYKNKKYTYVSIPALGKTNKKENINYSGFCKLIEDGQIQLYTAHASIPPSSVVPVIAAASVGIILVPKVQRLYVIRVGDSPNYRTLPYYYSVFRKVILSDIKDYPELCEKVKAKQIRLPQDIVREYNEWYNQRESDH